jgi:Protein of unknown function (DUF2946)
MRRRLRKLLPIVFTALAVQILAPVIACWGASMAPSDPLHGAVICHSDTTSSPGPTDHSDRLPAHDGCCSLCSVAQTAAPVDVPLLAATTPSFESSRVVWLDRRPDCFGSRAGALAHARGPPALT